jgi:hypothetical protein
MERHRTCSDMPCTIAAALPGLNNRRRTASASAASTCACKDHRIRGTAQLMASSMRAQYVRSDRDGSQGVCNGQTSCDHADWAAWGIPPLALHR